MRLPTEHCTGLKNFMMPFGFFQDIENPLYLVVDLGLKAHQIFLEKMSQQTQTWPLQLLKVLQY